jgi:hypothetical protein
MFELLVILLIGLVASMSAGRTTDQIAQDLANPDALAPLDPPLASGPAVADRPHEPQTPTGLYTTATEVKPILGMTRASWVAIQEQDGTDFVYFTNLIAWRCGLWEIRFGLNGEPPETALPLEPCYEDTASPNAITDPVSYPIYIVAPGGSVESIDLEILFDDGTSDAAVFARQSVLMPG